MASRGVEDPEFDTQVSPQGVLVSHENSPPEIKTLGTIEPPPFTVFTQRGLRRLRLRQLTEVLWVRAIQVPSIADACRQHACSAYTHAHPLPEKNETLS